MRYVGWIPKEPFAAAILRPRPKGICLADWGNSIAKVMASATKNILKQESRMWAMMHGLNWSDVRGLFE
jgi:hypothetical protein